jgi:S-adenosylmethionine decarboxylase
MFQNYQSSGKHMICDFKGIQNVDLLQNCSKLKQMLIKICNDHDFKILQEQEHEFTPQGCSILFLLSESHLSIHTFPEKNHMSFDIYTCRQYSNNNEYNKMYEYLINTLQANDNSVFTIVDRYF